MEEADVNTPSRLQQRRLGRRSAAQRLIWAWLLAAAGTAASAQDIKPAAYKDLVNYCPAQAVQQAVLGRKPAGDIHFHAIDQARGRNTNLDQYEVDISTMPKLAGAAAAMKPAEFFEHARKNLTGLLDASVAKLEAFENKDGTRWASADPVTALMVFKINVASLMPGGGSVPLRLEQGLVVTAEVKRSATHYYWRFATLHAKETGDHPVSGTREFGLRKMGASWRFYTRGADRATNALDALMPESTVFAGADALWMSMQKLLSAFINDNGGKAVSLPRVSMRAGWDETFVQPKLFRSDCAWLGGAIGKAFDEKSSRAALALAIERDSTGMAASLTTNVMNALATSRDEETRAKVLRDAQQLGTQLRAVNLPQDIERMAASQLGRRYGLGFRRPAFDAATMRFVDPRAQPGTALMGPVVIDSDAAVTHDNLTRALLQGKELPASAAQVRQLLGAVAGLPRGATVDTFLGAVTDQSTRASMRQVMRALSGETNGEKVLTDLGQQLVGEAARRLDERAGQVAVVVARFDTTARAFRAPEVMDLMAGNISADGLAAGGRALASLASLTGNEDLMRDINRASALVQSGVEIYKGASLLAAGLSGGSFVAAVSVLNGAGGLSSALGGGQDNTRAMMKAIARLAAMIVKQFAIVNGKLDSIQASLSRIEQDLQRIERVAENTLIDVQQTKNAVFGLYTRLDQLESGLVTLTAGLALDECKTMVSQDRPSDLKTVEFQTCLSRLSRVALYQMPQATPNAHPSDEAAVSTLFRADAGIVAAQRWRAAAMLARAQSNAFDDAELGILAGRELRTNDVASAEVAAEAASALAALIKRRGERRITATDVPTYVRNYALNDILRRLDAIDNFQRELAGKDDQILARLTRIVDLYAKAQAPFVATLKDKRREVVLQKLVPSLVLQTTPFSGQVHNCNSGAVVQPFDPGTLPNEALSHGGFYWRKTPNGPLVKTSVLPPLQVCLKSSVVDGPVPDTHNLSLKGWFTYSAVATFEVRMFGKPIIDNLSTSHGWSYFSLSDYRNEPTHAQVRAALLLPQLRQQLEAFFKNPDNLVFVRERMTEALLASDVQVAQLRNLGALIAAQTSVQAEVKEAGMKMDAALGMMRGHLTIAFPATYAAHGTLRARLEGDILQRVPDTEGLLQTIQCAAVLAAHIDAGEPVDGRAVVTPELVSRLCKDVATAAMFEVEAMRSLERRFDGAASALANILRQTDFTHEAQYRSSPQSLAAQRLRAFIADGDKAWFYPVPVKR